VLLLKNSQNNLKTPKISSITSSKSKNVSQKVPQTNNKNRRKSLD